MFGALVRVLIVVVSTDTVGSVRWHLGSSLPWKQRNGPKVETTVTGAGVVLAGPRVLTGTLAVVTRSVVTLSVC